MDFSQANTGLWNPIIQMGIIAVTLLIANFLRRKITFFRRSMMPTAVIGGFLLLIVKLFDVLPIDISFMEALTYHCIAIGFIALSLQLPEKTKQTGEKHIGVRSGAIIVGSYLIQGISGLIISLLLSVTVMPGLFQASGILLPLAFGQGPGQANNTGATYENTWGFVGGRSFGLALAAAGYICACLIGVVILYILEKKGQITPVDHDAITAQETVETFQAEKELPISESIDRLSVQLALVAGVYLITYLFTYGLTTLLTNTVPGVASMINGLLWGFNFLLGSAFAIAMRAILMGLNKKGIVKHQYQNNYLLGRISGMVFDVMIVAAIVSIEIHDLTGLILPFILMVIVGAVVTYFHLHFVCKKAYKDYYYEGFISMYGMMTGTVSSGVILLREIDPKMETPAANNLIVGSSFAIIFGAPILAFVGMAPKSTGMIFLIIGAMIVYYLFLLWIACGGRRKETANE